MNAGQFARRLAIIEHQHKRSRDYRRRAVRSLMREAKAVLIIIHGKAVGWRLPNGQIVCKKRRYRTELDAKQSLMDIQAHPMTRKVPQRVYSCHLCHGI